MIEVDVMATLALEERDESKEKAVRDVFLEYLRRGSVELIFDGTAASEEHEDGELYIGSHECQENASDNPNLWIELWAFRGDEIEPGDFLGWRLLDDAAKIVGLAHYCPSCGLDLDAAIDIRELP